MGTISKSLVIFLILAMAISSIVMLQPKTVGAQTMPIPSVPDFTVRYVENSYDVPPIYGIDQYTGKNVTVQAGYHVDNRTIEFTIKNQQFAPYNDLNGKHIELFYNFRWKGNYGNTWTYFPLDSNGRSVFHYGTFYNPVDPTAYAASNSDYSILKLDSRFLGPGYSQTLPNGIEVSFEVQALMGYFNYDQNGYFNFNGNQSDWSNPQTVTIGETTAASPTPVSTAVSTPSLSPTITELSWLIIVPLALFFLAIVVIVRYRRKR
jgi:hypothetical protein